MPVTMTAAKSVTATFTLEQHLLKVIKGGTGSGTVVSTPAGINCGTECEASFDHGTSVTLKGTPAAGSQAATWSGCDSVNGSNECVVSVTAAKTVTATFALEQHLLKVTKDGTGSGTVTSAPAGINCGTECEATYAHGTAVTLKGAAGAGSKAVAWSGCDSVNGSNECLVTMTAAKAVTATFAVQGKNALSVTKGGNGSGTVVSTPAAVNCGPTCSAEYTEGTAVTLKGTADSGSEAVAWSGCDSVNGSNECLVTMTAAKSVTATFTLERHPLKVTKSGTGSGTVTSAPAGINCGTECEAAYAHGTAVTLKASLGAGTESMFWVGCDSVNGSNECLVTMNAAKTVRASFVTESEGGNPVDCTGAGITGAGSTLQGPAQSQIWGPRYHTLCPSLTVGYEAIGSGAGLSAWGFNGGSFDKTKAFIGSDDAPNAAQLKAAGTASGSNVLVVPVAQTAIGIVVNPPTNCEIEEITNKQLESIMRGNIKI